MVTDQSGAPTHPDPLVSRAQSGDRAAFTALIQAHDSQMRALVYAVTNTQSGMDDILQTAYFNAYRSIGRFRADAKFSTWLHRIVYNAAIDQLRKRKRQNEVSLEAQPGNDPRSQLSATEPSSEARFAERDALTQALATLTPDQRAVVLLVDAHGHDYQSAADILDINVGTIASRLSRARSALRTALETNGGAL